MTSIVRIGGWSRMLGGWGLLACAAVMGGDRRSIPRHQKLYRNATLSALTL